MVSRSIPHLILNIFCMLAGALIMVAGIYSFASSFWRSITGFVLSIYFILSGLSVLIFEIFFPSFLVHLFGFYTYWIGRSCFFIIVGLLILGSTGFFLAVGIIVLACALVCFIMHFIISCPGPLFVRQCDNPNHHNNNAQHA